MCAYTVRFALKTKVLKFALFFFWKEEQSKHAEQCMAERRRELGHNADVPSDYGCNLRGNLGPAIKRRERVNDRVKL